MSDRGLDTGRLARTLVLIAFVTTVFVLLAADQLGGSVLRVGLGAIGAVAFVTAITAFLIAAGEYYDDDSSI